MANTRTVQGRELVTVWAAVLGGAGQPPRGACRPRRRLGPCLSPRRLGGAREARWCVGHSASVPALCCSL